MLPNNILFSLLFYALLASAQNLIGVPEVINFQKSGYEGGTHNWNIQQDCNRILHFANDEGLLSDYTNLSFGYYVFRVKGRNNFGNESKVSSSAFTTPPPWYQSTLAYLLYSSMLLSLKYYIYRKEQKKYLQQRIKLRQQQRGIKYLHQLEIDKSEKELVKLKNEKLKAEIEARNSELASTAMHLVQKGELLSKIKDDLNKLNKVIHNEEHQSDIKRIVRVLTSEEKADKSWEQFAIYFDKVHTDFLMHMKSAFPGITSNDLRLLTYLKMNLSTKEIAQLMKISPRGVEISRYRLRKKMLIPGDVSLYEFLRDFQANSLSHITRESS